MSSLLSFAIVGAVAAATTFVLVPLATRLAVRVGASRAPDAHHIHEAPTPAAGGLAMLAGVVVAVAAAPLVGGLSAVFDTPGRILGGVAAATLIFGVGFFDDVRGLSPPAKVAGMSAAGVVLHLVGISIVVFRVPFWDLVFLSQEWSLLITVLWVVGMANAVNLIDGLDGLAAGTVAIAAGTFLLYALRLEDQGVIDPANSGSLWAAIALGVCVGFLPHNLHPARVFMGDGGALLLGALMAAATISVGGRSTVEFSGQAFFFYAPMVIPLVILGVPVVDMVFAIVRRTVGRRGFSVPDREHLHHRLMRLGHGHRRAVILLWLWTALLSAFVLYPTYTGRGDGVVPAGIAALALILYTIFHPPFRLRRRGGGRGGVGPPQRTLRALRLEGAPIFFASRARQYGESLLRRNGGVCGSCSLRSRAARGVFAALVRCARGPLGPRPRQMIRSSMESLWLFARPLGRTLVPARVRRSSDPRGCCRRGRRPRGCCRRGRRPRGCGRRGRRPREWGRRGRRPRG